MAKIPSPEIAEESRSAPAPVALLVGASLVGPEPGGAEEHPVATERAIKARSFEGCAARKNGVHVGD
jgi:hypothetical protein